MSTKKPVTKKTAAKKMVKKDYGKMAMALHKKLKGKLEIVSKGKLITRDDWSTMYSPGVGAVSSHLAKFPKDAREYTMKRNSVAVISDGTAVLGLGNIGPIAALPVMEGKCAILKEMANIDGFPIVLDVHDEEGIVQAVKAIAPTFGAINLEDNAPPQCFQIEELLMAEITNPEKIQGDVMNAITGADAVVGVSGPGTIAQAHVTAMAERAIVFGLA